MRTSLITHLALIAAASLLTISTADAQDTGTTTPMLPTADTGSLPLDPALPPLEPVPLPPDTTLPETAPPWAWQHQTQNQQGTVTNLHERTQSQDGSAYNYQHSVTRPNGSQTQLREYSQTEEGYQLMQQQRFYQPDGTLLREHSMSVNGTDPYNYQRQMTNTFRDGRTMEKSFTRSYDGTAGTMERSFIGPNGQVHQFERPWTPEDLADTSTPIVDPLAPATATKADEGFFSRLNPFKKRDSNPTAGSPATAKRSGFTIGSFGRSHSMDTMPPGQARKASGLSNSSQMRSMKTQMKQTGPPSHAAASLPGKAGKTH